MHARRARPATAADRTRRRRPHARRRAAAERPARAGVHVPCSARRRRPSGDGGREYARDDGTPAWEALEAVVGELEGGEAVAFSSGMAAAASVLDLLPAGAAVVAPTDCYSGVKALLADGQRQGRWTVVLVDVTDTDAVLAAAAGADLLWLESPTNPLLDVADLPALCARRGRAAGRSSPSTAPSPTPLLQHPLALGADVVVHSATKFIGGHSDLLLGVAVAAPDARRSGCGGGARSPARRPGRWRPSWRCAACARWGCGSSRAAQRGGARPPAGRAPGRVPRPLPGSARRPRPRAGRRADERLRRGPVVRGRRRRDRRRGVRRRDRHQLGHQPRRGREHDGAARPSCPGRSTSRPGCCASASGCEHVEDLWDDLVRALPLAEQVVPQTAAS